MDWCVFQAETSSLSLSFRKTGSTTTRPTATRATTQTKYRQPERYPRNCAIFRIRMAYVPLTPQMHLEIHHKRPSRPLRHRYYRRCSRVPGRLRPRPTDSPTSTDLSTASSLSQRRTTSSNGERRIQLPSLRAQKRIIVVTNRRVTHTTMRRETNPTRVGIVLQTIGNSRQDKRKEGIKRRNQNKGQSQKYQASHYLQMPRIAKVVRC